MGGLGRRPFQKLLEDRTKIGVVFFEQRPQQHSAGNHEELVPQLPGLFESCRPERFHLESRAAQGFCRSTHCRVGFWRNRRAAIVLEITDPQFFDFLIASPAHRHGRGARIAVIGPLHYFE